MPVVNPRQRTAAKADKGFAFPPGRHRVPDRRALPRTLRSLHRAGTPQKRPPIRRRKHASDTGAETWTSCRGACLCANVYFGRQHDPSSS
jgi:hypothetical protein